MEKLISETVASEISGLIQYIFTRVPLWGFFKRRKMISGRYQIMNAEEYHKGISGKNNVSERIFVLVYQIPNAVSVKQL